MQAHLFLVGARVRAVVSEVPNGPGILLGVGRADRVHELQATWLDGHVATRSVAGIDTWREVHR